VLVPEGLITPCLLVEAAVLEANIAAMARRAQDLGAGLRPHAKTHKCLEIAVRQLAAGAVGLTVATVAEAEVFAAVCDDLFIAYPLWVDARRGARLRALAERARVRVGVDSAESAEALARHVGDAVAVVVEVDSGHHRSGVDPALAGVVAVAAARAGLPVAGVFTFPGHSYAPGSGSTAAADEAAVLTRAAESIRAAGLPVEVRSGGSTPSAAATVAGAVSELRPGVYVFGDSQQLELGSCLPGDVALVAVGTVVSRCADRVILDAGSKVLGADRPAWASGFGTVLGHPAARVLALSEHHATVHWPQALPDLGSTVAVVPNHVCNAVNLADELLVTNAGEVVDRWAVAARGANT
jgi:D-serine deaminase-like pyridoxal phosphate-dependent protein